MAEAVTEHAAPAAPLPWHRSPWQKLLQAQRESHLPHAVLLGGATGIGKRQFAQALAELLLCERPGDDGACGQCRQCGFSRAGTHPDLKWVMPEESGKQIRVEQIREVVGFLSHTAQQGGYKVCVIYPAENMNINAANALLKSLEEPAGDTLLVLVSDAPGRLMATIRSRCQLLRLPVPDPQQSADWLAQQLQPEPVAELLVEFAQQPLRALAYHQSGTGEQYRQWDEDFVSLAEGGASAVALAQDWQQYELAELLQWLGRRLSALIAAQSAAAPLANRWAALAGKVPTPALFPLLDQIQQVNQQLNAGGNPNRQLVLENLLLVSCDKFHN